MGIKGLKRDVLRKINEVGLMGTLKHISSHTIWRMRRAGAKATLAQDPFDLRFGTETSQPISVGSLDIPDANLYQANRYEPANVEICDEILLMLPFPYEEFTFIDVGSGKGRVVLLASQHPFQRIIGCELSKQ